MRKLAIKWSALRWAFFRFLKYRVYKVPEGILLPKSLKAIAYLLFPRRYVREIWYEVKFDHCSFTWEIFGCNITEEALRMMTRDNTQIRVRGYEEGKTIIELIQHVPTTK